MSYGKKTKVVAVINQKGGVGKTTTVANLAYALAGRGKDVLCIDFDSQASLSYYFNVGLTNEEEYISIGDLLEKETFPQDEDYDDYKEKTLDELITESIVRPTYVEFEVTRENGRKKPMEVNREFGIDLIPSNLRLTDYELVLANENEGFKAKHLSFVIEDILELHEYDYILIDCNPSLGLMTMNAIVAARDGILIPTNLDLLSTKGVSSLIETVAVMQGYLKEANIEHYGIVGIVLNLYSDRRLVDRKLEYDVRKFFPIKVFETRIPESVNARKAVYTGRTYSQLYPKAAEAYKGLSEEFEETLTEMEARGPVILTAGEDATDQIIKKREFD